MSTHIGVVKASLFEIIRNPNTRSSEEKRDSVLGYLGTNGTSELLEGLCNKEAVAKFTVAYNGYSFSLLDVSFAKGKQDTENGHAVPHDNAYKFKAKDVVLERELG